MKLDNTLKNETKIFPSLIINRQFFEPTFKFVFKKLLCDNKLNSTDIVEINKQLIKTLVKDMKKIDFGIKENKELLDEFMDDLWESFYKVLRLKIINYKTKFIIK